jgi:putative endonuclease
MTTKRRALGDEGEARAAALLAERGYRIVDRNVRAGGVELDVIARRGDLVVFIEVKTRTTDRYGGGAQAVDTAKQQRIVKGAAAWLHGQRARARRVRFDVISCVPRSDGMWKIEHIEGAFDAEPGTWP